MGGGLMQLVAYGAQDIYLTGNPQITFFKVVYRRHTNFSMEAIEQTWNGSDVTDGRCTATISRNGDLVGKMYLEVTAATTWDDANPGYHFINDVTIEIGGQQIDKHPGHFLEVFAELTQPNEQGICSNGKAASENIQTNYQKMTGTGGVESGVLNALFPRLYVPLQFWFCRNPGLALPLIALQYHEVKVILDHHIVGSSTGAVTNKLYCDYIYLDTDERRRFAQVSHEYLIEQVQYASLSSNTSHDLNFNHPVKEIIWTGGYTPTAGSTVRAEVTNANWNLKLNGHDRMSKRPREYFTRVQVSDYHTGCGGLLATASSAADDIKWNRTNDSIAVYSFALKPEEHQPSGTCNFSRIDNAQLIQDGSAAPAEVYAVNYNVLRIMSGMGGLAYSN